MRHPSSIVASLFLPLALAPLAACGPDDSGESDTSLDQDGADVTDSTDAVEVPWDVQPPDGGCPAGWTCRLAELPPFKGVDILVVVDDSASMAEEQALLAEQFPGFIEELLWPVLSPYTGRPVSLPVNDVHIGVVSTDMGTAGHPIATCDNADAGKDGILQNEPNASNPACEDVYPIYLGYDEVAPVPEEVDWMGEAFSCIAQLGTDGCGLEQQMEAALKALTANSEAGEPNAGFLRDDTVLVVVWLTDEDDASVEDESFFDTDSELPGLNIRHYEMPELLYPLARYTGGLGGLREGSYWPMLLAMVVGTPLGEPGCEGTGDGLGSCLDAPLMQYVPTTMTVGGTEVPIATPSCNTDAGKAYPPIRFVEMAQAFGGDAFVQSICEQDFRPALDFISNRVSTLADLSCPGGIVQLDKDPGDDCSCLTECRVVHVLQQGEACPAGTQDWDPDGDGTPETVPDGDGTQLPACEVPYAGTIVDKCERLCLDPLQVYSTDGEGWYYALAGDGVACPSVAFTGGMETPAGGWTFVACPPR